jgi:hypothetical protein
MGASILENTRWELGFNENNCSCPLNVGVQLMKEEEPSATLLKNGKLVKRKNVLWLGIGSRGNLFEKHRVDDCNDFSNKSFQKDCQNCSSVLESSNIKEKEPMTNPLKIQGDNLEP